MKVSIKGCKGIGRCNEDTECILREEYENGVIVVMVDVSDATEDNSAEEIARMVMDGCMKEKETLAENAPKLIAKVSAKADISDKVSVAVLVADGKKLGIACTGKIRIVDVSDCKLETGAVYEGRRVTPVHVLKRIMPNSSHGVLVATDGFWSKVEDEEILIDYTKAETANVWISYLMTRIGARLTGADECYSAVAIMCE